MAIISIHYRRLLVNLFTVEGPPAQCATYEAWRWVRVMGTDYEQAYDTLLGRYVHEQVSHDEILSHSGDQGDFLSDPERTLVWST